MNTPIQDKFLAYLEGDLDTPDIEAFSRSLEASPELREELSQYEAVLSLLRTEADRPVSYPSQLEGLAERVLAAEAGRSASRSVTRFPWFICSLAVLFCTAYVATQYGANIPVVNFMLMHLEGGLGALFMVTTFLAAFLMLPLRQYRLAGACLSMSLAAFVLRSSIGTFFNDSAIMFTGSARSPSNETARRSPSLAEPGYDFRAAPVPTYGTERYAKWVANDWRSPAAQPLSTFSVDVDTGSYTNVRRFLSKGRLPPPEAIRAEEFLNYFQYSVEPPPADPLKLTLEAARSRLYSDRRIIKVQLVTRSPGESRPPWNLVFLVDVSGSMQADDKLPLIKQSLRLLVTSMRPGDQISVVAYAGEAGVKLTPTGVSDSAYILRAIDALQASGSTNGGAGLDLAYSLAQSNLIPGGVNRVVLATDGDFNVGVTSFESLLAIIDERRRSGITLTTVGVGEGDIREDLMEQLADHGDGNYFYLDSFTEARDIFTRRLSSTTEVVAKDVKVQIEFNPATVGAYRLVGYENRALPDSAFRNDEVDAGEIGPDFAVTALYEVKTAGEAPVEPEGRYASPLKAATPLTEAAPPKDRSELGYVSVRYKSPDGSTSRVLHEPISSQIPETGSGDLHFAESVAAFARSLSGGQDAVPMSAIESLASENIGSDQDGKRRQFLDLVRNAAALMGRR